MTDILQLQTATVANTPGPAPGKSDATKGVQRFEGLLNLIMKGENTSGAMEKTKSAKAGEARESDECLFADKSQKPVQGGKSPAEDISESGAAKEREPAKLPFAAELMMPDIFPEAPALLVNSPGTAPQKADAADHIPDGLAGVFDAADRTGSADRGAKEDKIGEALPETRPTHAPQSALSPLAKEAARDTTAQGEEPRTGESQPETGEGQAAKQTAQEPPAETNGRLNQEIPTRDNVPEADRQADGKNQMQISLPEISSRADEEQPAHTVSQAVPWQSHGKNTKAAADETDGLTALRPKDDAAAGAAADMKSGTKSGSPAVLEGGTGEEAQTKINRQPAGGTGLVGMNPGAAVFRSGTEQAQHVKEAEPVADNTDRPAFEQISGRTAEAAKNGEYSFEMKLYPEGMGRVKVSMVCENKNISLVIETRSDQTKEIISSQTGKLKAALMANRYELSGVEIRVGDGRAENQAGFDLAGSGAHEQKNRQPSHHVFYDGREQTAHPGILAAAPGYFTGMLSCTI